jgi:type III secretion protein T
VPDLEEFKWLADAVKTLLVILPRIAGVFLVFPLFSRISIPVLVRGGVALSVACILYPPVAQQMPAQSLSGPMWALLTAKEAFIGLLIGFAFSVLFWVLESVGGLIDYQSGAGSAAVFDPFTGHAGGPMAGFLLQLGLVLFLASGGLIVMLGALYDSYQAWPIFSFFPDLNAAIESFAIRQTDSLWVMIVKLGAPTLLLLVLVDLGLGLVNRFAPQLNVFLISMPVKGALSVFLLALFLSYLYESLKTFLAPDGAILRMLKSALS